MVCYRIIIALEIHWLLGQLYAGSGAGNADLQGTYRVWSAWILQPGQSAGARKGYKFPVVLGFSSPLSAGEILHVHPDHLITSLVIQLADD
jgi:hypothetical protein